MEISNYMDEFRKELERKFFRPKSIDNYAVIKINIYKLWNLHNKILKK